MRIPFIGHKHSFVAVRMLEDGHCLMKCSCGEVHADLPFPKTKMMLDEERRVAEGEDSLLELIGERSNQ